MQKKKVVGIVAGFVILALMVTGAVWAYVSSLPKPTPTPAPGSGGEEEFQKTVMVTIQYDDVTREVELKTNETYLREALEKKITLQGEVGAYGLYVKTVDGRLADESKQEWWCLTKGGETLFTGVDSTPINDGDRFELTLKVGYDEF